jgi:polysaccharide biosynthesis PFTS motif protein
MNIPIVSELINKKGRSKLRSINKGYRELKGKSKLYFPMKLAGILSKTELYNAGLLKGLLCQSDFDIELSIRQYFTVHVLGASFNRSILYSIGSNNPLKHPLPKEWRSALIAQGVGVNDFGCALLWRAYSLLFWGRGVLKGLKGIYFLLKKQPSLGKYVYFDNLDDNNISANPNRHNIVNWYLRWKNKNTEINSVCLSASGTSDFKLGKVDVVQTVGLPKLRSAALLKYIGFLIYAMIYSFIRMFFKPTYGFFLEESIKLKRVDLANDIDLARDYLFNNSSPYYRPIWTYVAESKGSRILFYFYSTHTDYFHTTYIENFKIKSDYTTGVPLYLMSWPHYLVWDKFQACRIKNHSEHNPIIEDVGHIWFSSSDVSASVASNSIAVFDITPRRLTTNILTGMSFEYYNFDIANQFLNDIQLVLDRNNIGLSHKIKRIIKTTHKGFLRNLRQLKKESNYVEIDPSIDALQVIRKTKACISMPFTSTAVIAKQEGKPSAYYDPTGMVQKDAGAAHGIPVLSGINELEDWVNSINNGMSQ